MFLYMFTLTSVVMSSWLAFTIPGIMKIAEATSGMGASMVVFVVFTFMVLRSLVSRAIGMLAHNFQ